MIILLMVTRQYVSIWGSYNCHKRNNPIILHFCPINNKDKHMINLHRWFYAIGITH